MSLGEPAAAKPSMQRRAFAAIGLLALGLLGAGVAQAGFIAAPVEYETDTRPIAVAIGKLDPGPTRDIAVAHRDGRTVAVLYGDGNGAFSDAELLETMSLQATGVAIAKVDGDKRPDLVVAGDDVSEANDDRLLVLRGKPGGFRAPKAYPLPTRIARDVALADLDRDGRPDAVIGDSQSSSIALKYGKGNGAFGPARKLAFPRDDQVPTEPQDMTIGDFDRDRFKDIAVPVGRLGAVGVLYTKTKRRNGKRRPKRAFRKRTYDIHGMPFGLAAGDLNGDGRLDLAAPNGSGVGVESISVLYGKGRGRRAGFRPSVEVDLGQAPTNGIAVGRFNPGQRLDIAVGGNGGDLVYLYGQADGFSAPFEFGSFATVVSLEAARLNGDAEDDLVVAQFNGGGIAVVLDEQ